MKNPKIEFYKIRLKPTAKNLGLKYRNVLERIHDHIHSNEDIDFSKVTDNELKESFYQHLYNSIDLKFYDDSSKKKAFYARSEEETPIIKLNKKRSLVEGRIKGGHYETGKNIGNLTNPNQEEAKLRNEDILLDDFYFLFHFPMNKDVGILILQSYTKENIADVIKPFFEKLFRWYKLTSKADVQLFMPKILQEKFKENSIVKTFKFGNTEIVNEMSEGVLLEDQFSVKIEITSLNNKINLNNLPYWLKKLNKGYLNLTSNHKKEIEHFSKRKAYLKNPEPNTSDTPFELDMEEYNITPTIFLRGKIDLDETGIPDWDQLKKYARKVLDQNIIPEVYPEDNLHDD